MKLGQHVAGAAAALAVSLACASAIAADLVMTVVPSFGAEGIAADGWSAIIVRLENTGSTPIRGAVEARTGLAGHARNTALPPTVAPFAIAPGATSIVRLPVRSSSGSGITVAARDGKSVELAAAEVHATAPAVPFLVDVHDPPRLNPALRGTYITVASSAPGAATSLPVVVGGAFFDRAAGDAVLPERAAEYSYVTAVVLGTDTLARLDAAPLAALAGYVLSGGTLALRVTRIDDLRLPVLASLVGGTPRYAGLAGYLRDAPSARVARTPTFDDPSDTPATPAEGDAVPGLRVRDALAAYEGGNLVASDFGASAAYGLGEVHLLAFDTGDGAIVGDAWVQARMVELARHAWERRAAIAFPQGGPSAFMSSGDVQRRLDPNETSRWAIAIACLLLLAYAAVAGPVSFSLASRAGKPLRALRDLAILSVATFFAVVILGASARGCRGQSRRLSLVEASGGMSRATVRRFRGYFTPRSRSLAVDATSDQGVLEVGPGAPAGASLVADRTGLRIEGLTTLPWETVVVREDDIATLGNGIALVRAPSNDIRIANRSGRDLRGIVVAAPGRGVFLIDALRDGASIEASSGTLVATAMPAIARMGSGPKVLHGYGLDAFARELDALSPGMSADWEALAFAAAVGARQTDWWPGGVPVLVAQADGGDGADVDSGLRLERDRMLVRVIGYGGEP